METFDDDLDLVLNRAGLPDSAKIKRRNKTTTKKKTRSDPLVLFSQLSLEQMKRLYDLYIYDFEMFGYSPDKFYAVAGKNVTA